MSKHANPAIVGGFVVVAVVLALSAVMIFGSGRYFRTTARVIVYFDGSVFGLRIGAPVRFRGIEIGSVKDIRINMTGVAGDPRHVRIPVLLSIDEDRLTAQGIRRLDLDDRAVVGKMVANGLRAQLETESLLTGIRYVAIDILPDTPVHLVHDPTYPEIPSVPNPGQGIPQKLDDVLAKLAELDVRGISDSAQKVLQDTDRVITSPHLRRTLERLDGLADELTQSVHELRPAVTSAVTPMGDVMLHVEAAVRELEQTARSLRRLSDQLSRDPGSLLRGGRP